jgi:hypothetical protein
MKEIKNIENLLKKNVDWKPSDIAFFKAIEWSDNNLTVVCLSQTRNRYLPWPDMTKDFLEVSIKFENVVDLTMRLRGPGIHQITGFDVIDISDNGWERINFEIEDYENGTISFFCEQVTIIL